MVTLTDYGSLLVLVLATGMIVSQLYYPPRVETRWRTRLRWLFYLGAIAVIAIVADRLFEVYRSVGL